MFLSDQAEIWQDCFVRQEDHECAMFLVYSVLKFGRIVMYAK